MGNEKNCYNCRNFQRYYIKGSQRFEKTGIGKCCKKNCIVNADGGCEDFSDINTESDSLIRDVLNALLANNPKIREYLEKAEKGGEK